MPQEFQVLRCYQCNVFQVDQVKKVNKWNCKMCGEKQSIKKVFFKGKGVECRHAVQDLNMRRGQSLESENTQVCDDEGSVVMASENLYTEEPVYNQDKASNAGNMVQDKWGKYAEDDSEEEEYEDGNGEQLQLMQSKCTWQKQPKSRKRKRNSENDGPTTYSSSNYHSKNPTFSENKIFPSSSISHHPVSSHVSSIPPIHHEISKATVTSSVSIDQTDSVYRTSRVSSCKISNSASGTLNENKTESFSSSKSSKWSQFYDTTEDDIDTILQDEPESIDYKGNLEIKNKLETGNQQQRNNTEVQYDNVLERKPCILEPAIEFSSPVPSGDNSVGKLSKDIQKFTNNTSQIVKDENVGTSSGNRWGKYIVEEEQVSEDEDDY